MAWRYASVTLFFAYLFIGLGAMQTFHQRRERQLYISQWFLLAALFWFPWIYSTANILLVAKPVRGALQAAIAWWYAGNLMTSARSASVSVPVASVPLRMASFLIPRPRK